MSNIQMDLTFRTDVNAPLLTTVLKTLLMQGDDGANVLTVALYSGAEAVDATGATVSGYLLREDGAKVPLSGSAAGNVVTVNLDKHCYLVAGAFGAYVRLKMGDVTRTILKIAGEIASEGDGPVVDIEEKLVSLEDIVAQMEEMVRVTEAAEAATSAANTAAQTANTAAGTAADAATTASGAASTANTAAERANTAAQALEEAPIPTGTVSTYQAGTSPTTPPTGTWQSTIPAVQQGQYLWTRTVQSYTNGNPTTYYSVARQGMDGSGSVESVDGVSPDTSGNVPLGAVRSVNGNVPDESGNVDLGELGGGEADSVAWDKVTGKPETYTPAPHGHKAEDVSGLAAVATSGDYNDLNNTPAPYELPPGSADTLGGVKVGEGLSVDEDGNLSAKIPKVLWEGSWSGGDITVPDQSKYTLFRISMQGQGTSVLAVRNNTYIRGIGGYSTAVPFINIYQFAATFIGDEWTFVACNSMEHKGEGNHSAVSGKTITSIMGLC